MTAGTISAGGSRRVCLLMFFVSALYILCLFLLFSFFVVFFAMSLRILSIFPGISHSVGLNTTCPGIEWTMQSMAYFVQQNLPKGFKLWMSELCYAIEYGDYVGPPVTPMLPRADFQVSAHSRFSPISLPKSVFGAIFSSMFFVVNFCSILLL